MLGTIETQPTRLITGTSAFRGALKSEAIPESPQPLGPVDHLPDLSNVASEKSARKISSKPGMWRKASMIALMGLMGLGALGTASTPAHAADVSVTIGRGGVSVQVGSGHHRGGHLPGGRYPGNRFPGAHLPGGRNPGGHLPGCGHHHHADGGYNAVGLDGQHHRFDRFGHVNDHTGHYQLSLNSWGQVIRIYNVGFHN